MTEVAEGGPRTFFPPCNTLTRFPTARLRASCKALLVGNLRERVPRQRGVWVGKGGYPPTTIILIVELLPGNTYSLCLGSDT